MTGAGRILTVSYGTFSCTLEGFDDPFGTMKAIAEYFRDLAAEDRYFGAEPPTPDAAMLHRIAETAIQRRVDAKMDGNGVVLRASEPQRPAAMPAVLPDSESQSASIAERLSRLRSDVAAQPVAAAAPATLPVVSFAIPDFFEDDPTETYDLPAGPEAADILPEDQRASETWAPESADLAPATAPAQESDGPASLSAPELTATDLAVASVLSALDRADAPPPPDPLPAASDEANATGWPPVTEEPVAESPDVVPGGPPLTQTPIEPPEQPTLAAAPVAETPVTAADQDGPSDAPVTPFATAPSETETVATTAATADLNPFPDALVAPSDIDGPDAGVPNGTEETVARVIQGADTIGGDLRPAVAEKLQRARARVIRIRQGEASLAGSDTDNRPSGPTVVPSEPPQSAARQVRALLSADDEAALQRELATLRAERAEDPDSDATAAPLVLSEPRRIFAANPEDESLVRLMQQTDTEMAGAETQRRQSAIAHLKAAVAATVAERKVTGQAPSTEGTVARLARYRADLERAVKSAQTGASDRPPAERPAPLVLVSEQRIDRPRPNGLPQAAPAASARSVHAAAGLAMQAPSAAFLQDADEDDIEDEDVANLFEEPHAFAEFCQQVGATTPEDRLEAAAAYLIGVERRAHFSRPQLLWYLSAVLPAGTYQREDGLRLFGTLLRDGRIIKVKRGQFALAATSRYLAAAARTAG